MQVWCSCISPSISTSFNLHYLGLASSFHVDVLPPCPLSPPPLLPCLPLVLCSTGSITGNPPPPTPLPSGIPNLIYTDMFSQHRKQPVPLTKLRSSQRMSRGAGLQGPIIEGLGSTTSSFERRKGDSRTLTFSYSPFLWDDFGPDQELTSSQSELMYSITAFIWASCVALNDVNDKDSNDGDVNALSAALTDPGCTAELWSLSLRRLSNLALKFTLLMGLCFSFFVSYPLILAVPAFLFMSGETLLFFWKQSLRDHAVYIHTPITNVSAIFDTFLGIEKVYLSASI